MTRDTITALRCYEPAHLVVARAQAAKPCAPQARDLEILRALWAHRFLTTHDVAELWWGGRAPRAAQRRLGRLFDAGYVVRFRPRLTRGSFPWTFALTRQGVALLREQAVLPEAARYVPPPLHNFEYVRHDLELNAWVIAYRRRVGSVIQSWLGDQEGEVRPVERGDGDSRELGDGVSVEGLRLAAPQLVRPDAVLELELPTEQGFGVFYLELDRTRRPDKVRPKLARYDALISSWWRHAPAHEYQRDAPYAIFICQDDRHLRTFLDAGDAELTGHEWASHFTPDQLLYPGRERILFANAEALHRGELEAWRVPTYPAAHPSRHGDDRPHRVSLPALAHDEAS